MTDELEDLRELRRLLEVMAYWHDPPEESRVGSLSRYVSAKDELLAKLNEIRAKDTGPKTIRRRI